MQCHPTPLLLHPHLLIRSFNCVCTSPSSPSSLPSLLSSYPSSRSFNHPINHLPLQLSKKLNIEYFVLKYIKTSPTHFSPSPTHFYPSPTHFSPSPTYFSSFLPLNLTHLTIGTWHGEFNEPVDHLPFTFTIYSRAFSQPINRLHPTSSRTANSTYLWIIFLSSSCISPSSVLHSISLSTTSHPPPPTSSCWK